MLPRPQLIDHCLTVSKLDALLAWRPEEMVMLTGVYPYWGTSVAVLRKNQKPLLLMSAGEPIDTHASHCDVQIWSPVTSGEMPLDALARTLHTACAGQHVGCRKQGGSSAPAGNAAESPPSLDQAIDTITTVDVSPVVEAMLAIKTADEVGKIRRANRIALIGLKTFFAQLEPGKSEAEVSAAVEAVVHACTGRDGIVYARAWAAVQTGPNTLQAGRFNRSSGRILQSGDTVIIELATCVDGYWSDLTRTGWVGRSPSTSLSKLMALVETAREAAFGLLKPGVSGAEVDSAARRVMDRAGLGHCFPHATGHPTGFRYHDSGPMLSSQSRELLEPGMVLTIEPGLYGEELGGGCRIEDNVVITEHGYELLSVTA